MINVGNTFKRNIIIISDCKDIAFNELYLTLAQQFNELNINNYCILPLVEVKNFSILQTAFSIRLMAEYALPGTVFLVIINSGASGDVARIFGETNNGFLFVGNNSGYFDWFVRDFGLKKLYLNHKTRSEDRPFGGKYTQAPTCAKLLSAVNWNTLGTEVDKNFLTPFEIKDGTVVYCDNFGLMKIKGPKIEALKEGDDLQVYINDQPSLKARFTCNLKNNPDNTWVIYNGSSLHGLPELACVRVQNSAGILGVQEGDIILWEKI